MEKRYYNFSCVTYADVESVQAWLDDNCQIVKHYAYIVHDKDDCEKHIHLILLLYNNKTCSALFKTFKNTFNCNTLVEPLHDTQSCYEYLIHKNNNDKYQYSKNDIITDNKTFFDTLEKNEKYITDNSIGIISDLLDNIPLEDMHIRYGRDFVINFKKYDDFARAVRVQRLRYKTPTNSMTETDKNIKLDAIRLSMLKDD